MENRSFQKRSRIISFLIFAALLFFLLCRASVAQFPPIGIIDFYGMRTITERQVRQALQIKEGDTLSRQPKDARRRLEALPGVVEARLNFVCCDNGKAILYVGVREKGTPATEFRSAPDGTVRLPRDVVQAGEEFQKALTKAIEKGDSDEDQSRGYAMAHDPAVRAVQATFITFAARDLSLLQSVLQRAADPRQRALAAQILSYAGNKRTVVTDLVEGMSDPSAETRNNSMRSLWLMAKFAQQAPEANIQIPMELSLRC